MTVSLDWPVRSRTKTIRMPIVTPKATITGTTQSNSSSRGSRSTMATRMPMATPAKAQWARASLKKAMRPPTTSEPTPPHMMLMHTSAKSARTLKG